MGKIRLILIACICLTLSCCSIPNHIKNAFTNCYTNTYTGLDTLINIDGYYNAFIFYNNGMVIETIYHLSESDSPKYNSYMDEVVEKPYSKDAKKFYNQVDCGNYVICGDTIKVQIISKYNIYYGWEESYERWYKIIDRNTLCILKSFSLTTKNEKRVYYIDSDKKLDSSYTISFKPMTKPLLDYYWILRKKWFWCDEQDWKNYMRRIKQLDKLFEKK